MAETNLNYAQRVSRLTVNIYHDKVAFDAGKPPVTQQAYPVSATAVPPSETNPAGFPSFDELVGTPCPTKVQDGPVAPGTTPVVAITQQVLYDLLLTQGEFEGGVIVP
jgi:hypothetical protein